MKGRPELFTKAHQVDTLQEALSITIHGSRGPDGQPLPVKAIAADMQVPTSKLYQAADGERKLAVDELPALIRATGNPLILDVLARKVGRVTFPLPSNFAEFPELTTLTAETAKQFAELLNALATAIADSRITVDEARRFQKEGTELIAVVCQAIEQVNANAVGAPTLRAVGR